MASAAFLPGLIDGGRISFATWGKKGEHDAMHLSDLVPGCLQKINTRINTKEKQV